MPGNSNKKKIKRKATFASASSDESSLKIAKSDAITSRLVSGYSVTDVVKFQKMWLNTLRPRRTIYIVEDYLEKGPTMDQVHSISFDALVLFLRDKLTIHVSKACLQRIHYLTTLRHGSPANALVPKNVNVRVFLAAFMIAYKPTYVFESMGNLEKLLYESAVPLLNTFESIVKHIHSSATHSFYEVPRGLSENFPSMLFEYLKRFKEWKIPDEAKLTCRIKHALIALYQAEAHLPPNDPTQSALRAEFRSQIERLRSKLQQIAGEKALRQFDEQRLAAPYTGPTSGGSGSGPGAGGAGGAYATTQGRMSNEQLAHELFLDPTFQLDDSGGCSMENPVYHRIRESMHQSFWDSLVDDIKLSVPCYTRVIRVLAEVRNGIRDLAGAKESAKISEVVDLEFIKSQVEMEVFTWDNCMKLIESVLEVIFRVQAPKRDDETKALWKDVGQCLLEATSSELQSCAFCKALRFLLDRVHAMRIDAANARLRLIAPVIRDHGIDYERGKFQDKLNDGSLTLHRTRDWIRQSIRREVLVNQSVEHSSLVEGKASTYVQVHNAAMLSLVSDSTPLVTAENCPETLLFDVYRLSLFQQEFRYIVTAATMLVTSIHAVLGTKNAGDQQALSSISDLLVSDSLTHIDVDKTVVEIGKVLEEKTSMSSELRTQTTMSLTRCASESDAVHRLLAQRVHSFSFQMMKEGKVPVDVHFTPQVRVLLPRIEQVTSKLLKLAEVNRAVHYSTYNTLISEEVALLGGGN